MHPPYVFISLAVAGEGGKKSIFIDLCVVLSGHKVEFKKSLHL